LRSILDCYRIHALLHRLMLCDGMFSWFGNVCYLTTNVINNSRCAVFLFQKGCGLYYLYIVALAVSTLLSATSAICNLSFNMTYCHIWFCRCHPLTQHALHRTLVYTHRYEYRQRQFVRTLYTVHCASKKIDTWFLVITLTFPP